MNEILDAIRKVGVTRGDTVMVHSRLYSFGPMAGVKPANIPIIYREAFLHALGEEGTLIVPTFTVSFGRIGKPFILESSPSEMGIFSESVRQMPDSRRTLHPIQSCAAIGKEANALTQDHPRWNVGADTIWERMLNIPGASVIGLGIPLSLGLSFVHHVEFLACVPYLYHKILRGEVWSGGKRDEREFYLPARHLNFGVVYGLERKLIPDLRPYISTVFFNRGFMQRVPLASVYEVCLKGLKADPYYLLKEPPTFKEGEIPIDGLTKDREGLIPSYYQKGDI